MIHPKPGSAFINNTWLPQDPELYPGEAFFLRQDPEGLPRTWKQPIARPFLLKDVNGQEFSYAPGNGQVLLMSFCGCRGTALCNSEILNLYMVAAANAGAISNGSLKVMLIFRLESSNALAKANVEQVLRPYGLTPNFMVFSDENNNNVPQDLYSSIYNLTPLQVFGTVRHIYVSRPGLFSYGAMNGAGSNLEGVAEMNARILDLIPPVSPVSGLSAANLKLTAELAPRALITPTPSPAPTPQLVTKKQKKALCRTHRKAGKRAKACRKHKIRGV